MVIRKLLVVFPLVLSGCTDPIVGEWSGVEDDRYEWRWWLYADETGEFEWKDRERARTREGDIEWAPDRDAYELALDCKKSVGDNCWSSDRELECALKKRDSVIDCERTDDGSGADFELERE